MKKLLITGANSYIGTSVEKWLRASKNEYEITTLDMRNSNWHEQDFSRYDSVFHVAGLVHKNENSVTVESYYKVNRDLPYAVAQKARNEGVKQFIFLSTMSVYSGIEKQITRQTKENPITFYGKSKLEAEKLLIDLETSSFQLVIIRPPMVYGLHATGNYTKLSKLAKYMPVFPNINNQRSMIYIDNLCEFVKKAIDYQISGIYFPQNKDFITTSVLYKEIRNVNGKKTLLISIFNPIINKFLEKGKINKLFNNLVYDKELSKTGFEYQIVNFEKSVIYSEGKYD